jgi:uncharacterized protein
MPPISMLIKPASSTCNMKCQYCFYHDVTNSREIANYGMMSDETIEVIIKKAFAYADHFASFGFQGGEPTLAGLDFFQKVVALQKKYNVKKIPVTNAIQTNGLTMNEEWAKFLHDNNFLVGLSLDGSKLIHDKYRFDHQGNGTFDRVLNAAKIMDQYQVEYNILSTVNIDVAKNIEKIYYFFKKQGFRYLQFIPCLDELKKEHGQNDYSLTPEAYGEFLKKLFDLWYVDLNTNQPMSIRYFDNLVMMLFGYPPESCGMSGVCSCYYMIEADGSVYPCDFYVTDEWRIGNIVTDELEQMTKTENAKRFVEISKQVAPRCKECEHYHICRGGCRRNREPIGIRQNNENYLCPAFKTFFDYAKDDLIKIGKKYLR